MGIKVKHRVDMVKMVALSNCGVYDTGFHD
ncbi:hypothetical protein MTR67_039782 [Solanum verrucosum]|uniref:Uncharacterized protein n=1 Tax=Solanum verrucosum TaxID=315347 RepID=A0AAF0ZNX0_SOLVR|nr:hypothetical protein MTR67_039782 [Solanum verrucosum]